MYVSFFNVNFYFIKQKIIFILILAKYNNSRDVYLYTIYWVSVYMG